MRKKKNVFSFSNASLSLFSLLNLTRLLNWNRPLKRYQEFKTAETPHYLIFIAATSASRFITFLSLSLWVVCILVMQRLEMFKFFVSTTRRKNLELNKTSLIKKNVRDSIGDTRKKEQEKMPQKALRRLLLIGPAQYHLYQWRTWHWMGRWTCYSDKDSLHTYRNCLLRLLSHGRGMVESVLSLRWK